MRAGGFIYFLIARLPASFFWLLLLLCCGPVLTMAHGLVLCMSFGLWRPWLIGGRIIAAARLLYAFKGWSVWQCEWRGVFYFCGAGFGANALESRRRILWVKDRGV